MSSPTKPKPCITALICKLWVSTCLTECLTVYQHQKDLHRKQWQVVSVVIHGPNAYIMYVQASSRSYIVWDICSFCLMQSVYCLNNVVHTQFDECGALGTSYVDESLLHILPSKLRGYDACMCISSCPHELLYRVCGNIACINMQL